MDPSSSLTALPNVPPMMTEQSGSVNSVDDSESQIGNKCPPPYSKLIDYKQSATVTVYTSPTDGRVYRCKSGPISQYCNIFPPDWSRASYGGTPVHTSQNLGWEYVRECQPKVPYSGPIENHSHVDVAPEDVDDEPIVHNLVPITEESDPWAVNPADSGLGSQPRPNSDPSRPNSRPARKPRPKRKKPSNKSKPKPPGMSAISAPSASFFVNNDNRPLAGGGRPYRPPRPSKPTPGETVAMVQVKEEHNPIDGEDLLKNENGEYCYRSGRPCVWDAEYFACCTKCIDSVCV